MSYKTEVEVSGEAGWHSNALRFATEQEALEYGADLFSRWTLTTGYRATKCDDPVISEFKDGKLKELEVKSRRETFEGRREAFTP